MPSPVIYHITEDDYVYSGLLNGSARRKSRQRDAAIAVLAVSIGSALLYFSPWTILGAVLVGAGIGIGIGGIFVMLIRRFVAPMFWRKHYRKYPRIHKQFTVEMNAEGVRFTSPDGSSLLRWAEIHAWRENDEYMLVYQAPNVYTPLPKRIADAGFALDELRVALKEKVGVAIV